MLTRVDETLRNNIQANVARLDVRTIENAELRKAAVSLVVVPDETGSAPSVLLTLRPVKMNRHSNQYALPGGRLDKGETPVEAALRELHEELGVDLPESSVIGPLDDYATRSGFIMTPFVVWGGGDLEIKPDPSEVDSYYRIPFADLDSPDVPKLIPSEEGEHPVLCAPIASLGHTVYAPTAAILYQFREVAIRGLQTRVAHFDQPAFAWK